MAKGNQVIRPNLDTSKNTIISKVASIDREEPLIVNFSKLKLVSVCLQDRFNNHFKDSEHFNSVVTGFIGTVLPKITSHTYNEVREGGPESRVLHFHTVDETHREIIREILDLYGFPQHAVNQMLEGNDIIEFSATLGHVHAARMVCHKVNNILYLLFFDTNHHIYMNEKYLKDTLFYEKCPTYTEGKCHYMPAECFAFGYLDEDKLRESFGYSFDP